MFLLQSCVQSLSDWCFLLQKHISYHLTSSASNLAPINMLWKSYNAAYNKLESLVRSFSENKILNLNSWNVD